MDIKVFHKNLVNALVFLPTQLAQNAGTAFDQSKAKFASEFQRKRLNFPKSGPVQPAGGGLRRQTGALSRSFEHVVTHGNLDSLKVAHSSSGVKYARIHEYGGNGLPPRLGFFDFWEAHITSDLMPRLEAAVKKTVKEAGFKSA